MSRAVSARPKSAREPKDGWGLQAASVRAAKKQGVTLDLEEDLHLVHIILSNTTRQSAPPRPSTMHAPLLQQTQCRVVLPHLRNSAYREFVGPWAGSRTVEPLSAKTCSFTSRPRVAGKRHAHEEVPPTGVGPLR